MLPLTIDFDAKLFLRKVFTTNRRSTPVAFPMYLQEALEKHKCSSNPNVLKRLRGLAYKSLRITLSDSASFRCMVETMLNERPELLAQLMCDVYYGKVGDFTDWKYLHKLVATQAYPTKAAMAILDKEIATGDALIAKAIVSK